MNYDICSKWDFLVSNQGWSTLWHIRAIKQCYCSEIVKAAVYYLFNMHFCDPEYCFTYESPCNKLAQSCDIILRIRNLGWLCSSWCHLRSLVGCSQIWDEVTHLCCLVGGYGSNTRTTSCPLFLSVPWTSFHGVSIQKVSVPNTKRQNLRPLRPQLEHFCHVLLSKHAKLGRRTVDGILPWERPRGIAEV